MDPIDLNPAEEGETNRYWPYRLCSLAQLLECKLRDGVLPSPAPDEVVARVEAVSICSSDVKIVRLGANHPLYSQGGKSDETVLGHEVCLRVHAVGRDQKARFSVGQRLGLQPAMRVDGERRIIGIDLPGGFAQFLILGPEALDAYVFEVPESLPAAAIALLEPYACVERAYRANCRQDFNPGGRALFVLGPDAERYGADSILPWKEVVIARAEGFHDTIPLAFLGGQPTQGCALADLTGQGFDDIIALGEISAETLAELLPLMAEHGLLLQARQTATATVQIDPVRVHYDALAFTGTTSARFTDALTPSAQRFDVKPGGTALIHGAGGAMGRIHVHRLLQLEDGPATIIATSRTGQRLEDLQADFGTLARDCGRRLIVRDSAGLDKVLAEFAPGGVDDAVVVAPDVDAVAVAADALAPSGLLSVFAGFPYGRKVAFDLSGIAVTGKRLTGSTGCTVDDMQGVLSRALTGELDLMANISSIAGLDSVPEAILEVSRGMVSGKIVIYPQSPEEPLRRLESGWTKEDEESLI